MEMESASQVCELRCLMSISCLVTLDLLGQKGLAAGTGVGQMFWRSCEILWKYLV